MKKIRGKHEVLIYTMALLLFSCGCKSMGALVEAKTDVKAPIKATATAEVKADVNGQVGATNTVTKQTTTKTETTTAGRDMTSINDSAIMKLYIKAMDKQDERGSKNTNTLLGIIAAQFLLQGWMLKNLMKNQDKDDIFMKGLIQGKKEGKQQAQKEAANV